MSRLVTVRRMERLVAAQALEIELLRQTPAYQRELAFEEKLSSLLTEYGLAIPEVLEILATWPVFQNTAPLNTARFVRNPRPVKIYLNPHDGQAAPVKRSNHGVLRLWKKAYGSAVVESWRIQ